VSDHLIMYNDQIQKPTRSKLRKIQTPEEKILWDKLRNKKFGGFKFYRQYGVGPYILDFFCPKTRLAIELDGEIHKEKVEYDRERKLFIEDVGIYILRFWNREISDNLEKVLLKIDDIQHSLISPLG
jgi:very-short-patch-repair endonuclease